jgi:RNA polymerase sigma-70 factor (ECF subfamily)
MSVPPSRPADGDGVRAQGSGAAGDLAEASGRIAALRPMLLGLARLQLRNDSWAEDAVSETMIAAIEGLARFDRRSALATWVTGILKHKIVDQMRRNRREISIEVQRELAGGDDALEQLFRDDGHRVAAPLDWGDPQETATRGAFMDVLQACIDGLPAPLARAFLLREWLEMDTREVCKEMQISTTNCFVMLYRARMRLRECLEVKWFAGERPA